MSRKKIIAIILILIGATLAVIILYGIQSGKLSFVRSRGSDTSLLSQVTEENTVPSSIPETSSEEAIEPITKEEKALYTLTIPAINVTSTVDAVGLTKGGAMATSPNLAHVSWYKYGTKPGGVGTTVLAGHVNNALLLPGTFYHLKDLKVGDDIFITDAAGKKIHFVMSSVKVYDYKSTDTDDVFANTGVPTLKLITCEGTWMPSEHTYDRRLIVTAKLAAA